MTERRLSPTPFSRAMACAAWRCLRAMGVNRAAQLRCMGTVARTLRFVGVLAAAAVLLRAEAGYPAWSRFVKVQGQAEPIPAHWLADEEARIAYDLKLPDQVPGPVPFDFAAARLRAWLPGTPRVAVQYFNHLCATEAGEWIFKTVQNVEGLYFARPQGQPTSDTLTDPYGPEMPWIQRIFLLTGESLHWQGAWFIEPPNYNYRFVEQPRRNVKWQAGITEPYVRLFGYTRERALNPNGQPSDVWKDKTPMRVIGVSRREARYGYTWRGLTRPHDREHGIAGGEVLIYDLQTKEVLALRRQFLIARQNPRGEGQAMWEIAAQCAKPPRIGIGGEFTQFALDVLQTIEQFNLFVGPLRETLGCTRGAPPSTTGVGAIGKEERSRYVSDTKVQPRPTARTGVVGRAPAHPRCALRVSGGVVPLRRASSQLLGRQGEGAVREGGRCRGV